MSFQPVVPMSGYVGWKFLNRTMEAQKDAYVQSAPVVRATDHFRAEIGKVTSVDDFMADRRLLQVALGAFGLDDDIGNIAFIRKVLEEGTVESDSFANRLSDSRYVALSETLGFGNLGGAGRTQFTSFAEDLIARYEDRQFGIAVGEQNNDMRMALNVASGIEDLLGDQKSERGRWFAIMGNPPLRSVFETALGFPSSFGQVDIDQQLEQFQDRAMSVLGSGDPADFGDPELQEKLIRLFLVRSEAQQFQFSSSASVALSLLQAG
ncbi:DUF1217 domain-containing protein [Roseisalinus antarcticus]|uniref:DUF1217 domain-containing protein n=1 Tax=Roseisalinus antarcticus TaxID=254357 RepID=A0A1Y5TLQ7_9RHOB|nr:DUF1217 domain-containing protein [Roseisalinus antarcticus]SLN63166.1 hypothetical protein ROA7023_02958 [Roseisalinus antarcticus]